MSFLKSLVYEINLDVLYHEKLEKLLRVNNNKFHDKVYLLSGVVIQSLELGDEYPTGGIGVKRWFWVAEEQSWKKEVDSFFYTNIDSNKLLFNFWVDAVTQEIRFIAEKGSLKRDVYLFLNEVELWEFEVIIHV